MAPTLSILTPVLPRVADHLPSAAASVSRVRSTLGPGACEWVVVVDGPAPHSLLSDSLDGPDITVRHGRCCGVSAARTAALAAATGRWVLPLDADDELDADGVAALVDVAESSEVGWASGNRTLMDGSRTAHWNDVAVRWEIGSLAERWTAPFAFHPNSVLADRRLSLGVGGWPALPANEDLAWVLAVSEEDTGISTPHVVTRYRTWDEQVVSHVGYPADKSLAFRTIEALVNARRARGGRVPVRAPREPGGAHGAHPSLGGRS